MQIKHLSATSIKTFLACPAQWRSRYVGRGLGVNNDAAELGTAIHAAFETWVGDGHHLEHGTLELLLDLYEEHFARLFGHLDEPYSEGRQLVERWEKRQNWSDRRVVSTEQRDSFVLRLSDGTEIPFVYVIDRLDERDSGDLEVVDYKSGRWQLNHDQLRDDIQARSYATAAWLKQSDQRRYWVTFDYLRDEPIGVPFTAQECITHYIWLCRVAETIKASAGDEERLNPMCQFCHRKAECGSLTRHTEWGGHIGLSVDELVDRRVEVDHALRAGKKHAEELDELLTAQFAADEDLYELRSKSNNAVAFSSRPTRYVNREDVSQLLTDDQLAQFVKVGVGDIERLARAELDDDHRAQLMKTIKSGRSRSSIRVVRKS